MKIMHPVDRNRLLLTGRLTLAFTLMSVGLLGIVLAGFPWTAFAVDGTNLPGHDYAHFEAPSAFVCRNTCGGEPRCKAYTWVKPGFQGPHGQCWLKDSVPAIVKDRCCDSAARPQSASSLERQAEDHINRPGSDFRNFESGNWQECQHACAENEICSSWTYVPRGIQGQTGRCWLKNRVARPVPDAHMISGVKFREPPGRFD